MNDQDEERVAGARARSKKHGQDQRVPFLIRDDGMLYPNVPLVRKSPRFRLYYGDPKASLADRMRFLSGLSKKREVIYNPEPDEPFDIGKADVDALLNFAVEQFGRVLDANKPIKALREEVYALSQLPEVAPDRIELAEVMQRPDPRLTVAEPAAAIPVFATLGQPPEGHAIEQPAPTRGGRQPRGANAGTPRAAGTKTAEAA